MKAVLIIIFMLNGNPAGQLDPVLFDSMEQCQEVFKEQAQGLAPSKGEDGAQQSFRAMCIDGDEVKVLQ